MSKTALCIGINDYPGTESDLFGCVNDANQWCDALMDRGFIVSTLFDEQATGKAMRDAIGKLISKAKNGDSIVIQYSGHGTFIPDENKDEDDQVDECICPYDIMDNGPIVDDELNSLFSSKAEGVKLVVIADSCFSGTVAKFAPFRFKDKLFPHVGVRFLPPTVFLKRSVDRLKSIRFFLHPPGRDVALLLAGCWSTEYSYDANFYGVPNGAFTYVALAALKKLKPTATYADWMKAIRKKLPSRQYPQTPNLYGTNDMKKWVVFK